MSAQKQHPFSMIEEEVPLFFNWPVLSQLTTPTTQGSDISVWEDDARVVVECELPGINKEEVDITFEKDVITINASSKENEEEKNRKYFRKRTSSFTYRLTIPGNIDKSQEPKATLINGVMSLEFQKRQQDLPKKIMLT